ncbi:hypothetical protein PCE1_002633 [Barthelona sp. PCE]
MSRVRNFEEDPIINAYPEGQLIFEGQGLRLLNSRENTDISLIESVFEGKGFVGYVENTCNPLNYTSKLKAGTGFMIIKKICNENRILTHLDILLFNDITSDEHTSRRIPFPFERISLRSLSNRIVPMDENHLLFTIRETVTSKLFIHKCYILNVLTNEYRCLGEYRLVQREYSLVQTKEPNYIMLRKCQDDTIWHYNFSVNDMDEAHEPDIKQLYNFYSKYFRCYNSVCVCSVQLRDQKINELTIFDAQRNCVNLTERFPQLKGVYVKKNSNFVLLTLTQDVLSMAFIYSKCVVVHIENDELTISEGEMRFSNILCNNLRHMDLFENSFHDEGCVLFGTDNKTGRFGPIKFRTVDNEVIRLSYLKPKKIFFDGIAEVRNVTIKYYFFSKEKRLVILRDVNEYNSIKQDFSFLSVSENDFFVMTQKHCETGTAYCAKIHWIGSESKPITTILPHCGTENFGFIQGLPVNVDYSEDTCLVYLGRKMILELPPNIEVISVHGSINGDSACIVCEEAIHFFQLNVNGYEVEVQKHIIFENAYTGDVFFNPRPLVETPDHQLFIVHTYSEEAETQHLHCLDWSAGRFLEHVLLFECDEIRKGNSFRNFVGDSYIHVGDGIVKVQVEDDAIKTIFYTNNNLPNPPYMQIKHIHNLSNNTVQDMTYEEETKTMILKTYNVEEDPESMNPTVETFHLPSFLAEASIVEYHMPDYH